MRISKLLLLSLIAASATAASCKGQFGFEGDPFVPDPPGPRPQYGATVTAADSPRPISGGTLYMVAGNRALVSDPDRDAIAIVDLGSGSHVSIPLEKGADPGRAVGDDKGHVHVVLRGAGAIASISLADSSVVRTKVCSAPRGIAWDTGPALLRVACADGTLASMTLDHVVTTIATGTSDLRDIAVVGAEFWVSRFRAADIRVFDRAGTLQRTLISPPVRMSSLDASADASVAWRMIPTSSGVSLVHQRGRDPSAAPVKITEGGYTDQPSSGSIEEGSSPPPVVAKCKLGIVQSAVTEFASSGDIRPSLPISSAVLPVDIAVSGKLRVVVAAGNAHTKELDSLVVLDGTESFRSDCAIPTKHVPNPPGQAVAAAFDEKSRLVVQLREPAMLVVYTPEMDAIATTIAYGEGSREDTGHAIFHSNSGGFLACASCHPEGGDDGRVWAFEGVGVRRTQNLRGGVKAPFHWNGELADLGALTGEVLGKRMSGPALAGDQLAALATYLDRVPSMPPMTGLASDAIARGKALFESASTQCTSCHTGATYSNSTIVDVGTGGSFKVPSLRGVAWRAPYMHTGCAPTLAERFDPGCGGGSHGKVDLTAEQRSDMVTFLQSL